MPKESQQVKQEPKEPAVFEQVDERGRVRLDRPLAGAEAAAQDARHREQYTAERLSRFDNPKLAGATTEERREARRPAF